MNLQGITATEKEMRRAEWEQLQQLNKPHYVRHQGFTRENNQWDFDLDAQWKISHICASRVNEETKQVEYKVRWRGFLAGEDSWLTEDQFPKLEYDLLKQFQDEQDNMETESQKT